MALAEPTLDAEADVEAALDKLLASELATEELTTDEITGELVTGVLTEDPPPPQPCMQSATKIMTPEISVCHPITFGFMMKSCSCAG